MSKSIFVSAVHEDSNLIHNLKSWASKGLLGNGISITHETVDKRHEGYDAINKYLKRKIEGSSTVLVLIGRDTHNHDWVRAEVELANSMHKSIIVSRIPNTSGAVPSILINHPVLPFDPSSIKGKL